jgi:hypothetical protein
VSKATPSTAPPASSVTLDPPPVCVTIRNASSLSAMFAETPSALVFW